MTIPFFSIGVPTFNRREMLIQAILSITNQTFTDFEIIVGNSYHKEALSAESLGIDDPRIHFINHPEDPGVIAGYNILPQKARGRYFTWLADDDLFAPNFLETIYLALIQEEFPLVAFTTYMMGSNFDVNKKVQVSEPILYTGSQFLQKYLSKCLKVVGCYGVFDRQYLIEIGSMVLLADPESFYSDNWLAIRSGELEKVIYIDSPLVFFRAHDGSISHTSTNIESYIMSQKNLCRKYIEIFIGEKFNDNFTSNFYLLLIWCVDDFTAVMQRSKSINPLKIMRYTPFLKRNFLYLRGTDFFGKMIRYLIKKIFCIYKSALVRLLRATMGTR